MWNKLYGSLVPGHKKNLPSNISQLKTGTRLQYPYFQTRVCFSSPCPKGILCYSKVTQLCHSNVVYSLWFLISWFCRGFQCLIAAFKQQLKLLLLSTCLCFFEHHLERKKKGIKILFINRQCLLLKQETWSRSKCGLCNLSERVTTASVHMHNYIEKREHKYVIISCLFV